MVPSEIRLASDKRSLLISWVNMRKCFSALDLRRASQSAKTKRNAISGVDQTYQTDLTITEIRPVGIYAVNITFSDGYDRGIFPWNFLHALTVGSGVSKQQCEANECTAK